MYLSDDQKLSQQMGQFEVWCGKLFYYSGKRLGWRYIGSAV